MKKLNNKGFAIGTILYGLLIVMVLLMSLLMGTMAFGRSNSKKYVDEIISSLEKKKEYTLTIKSSSNQYSSDKLPQEHSVKCKYTNSSCSINLSSTTLKLKGEKGDSSAIYGYSDTPDGDRNHYENDQIVLSNDQTIYALFVNKYTLTIKNSNIDKSLTEEKKYSCECNNLTSTSCTIFLINSYGDLDLSSSLKQGRKILYYSEDPDAKGNIHNLRDNLTLDKSFTIYPITTSTNCPSISMVYTPTGTAKKNEGKSFGLTIGIKTTASKDEIEKMSDPQLKAEDVPAEEYVTINRYRIYGPGDKEMAEYDANYDYVIKYLITIAPFENRIYTGRVKLHFPIGFIIDSNGSNMATTLDTEIFIEK